MTNPPPTALEVGELRAFAVGREPVGVLDRLGAMPDPAGAPEPLTWLTASAGRETRLVLVDAVIHFPAAQKYTTAVTAAGEVVFTFDPCLGVTEQSSLWEMCQAAA